MNAIASTTDDGAQIDLSRAPLGVKVASALVSAVTAGDDRVERHYLEVKSDLDLTKKNDVAKIAKYILGSANRLPRIANAAFEGYGVMVIGVAPGEARGVPPIEVLELEKIIGQYLGPSGPEWDVVRVQTKTDNEVLVVWVAPPQDGQDPFVCRKEGESLYNGRVYVRADGETREAKAEELDLLLLRGKHQVAPEVSFAVNIVGAARPVQLDDERSIDEYVTNTKARLIGALPKPEPEVKTESKTRSFDVSGTGATNVYARAMESIAGSSALSGGLLGTDPETRTEKQYLDSIELWEEQIYKKWASVADALAGHALDGVVIRVANATKTFFHDVEVKIHLEGAVRGIDWRSKSVRMNEIDLDLPSPPIIWGPRQRRMMNPAIYSAAQYMNGPSAASSYRSPLDWSNSGSVDLKLEVGELRPRETYGFDDDELVLVLPLTTDYEVRGTWEITARDHNEIYEGELAVPVGAPADLTKAARKILGVD